MDRAYTEESLSYVQTVALAIVPKITSSFSIIGSGWIILEVLGDKTKQKLVYHRLLGMFSIVDVLASIWYFASSWPMPKGTENTFQSFGNIATCTTQGFFIQLGSVLFVYNAALTIYFVLVISYNVKEEVLKRNEIYFHAIPMVFGFATAIAGIPLELYNEANIWCWIAKHPDGCQTASDNDGVSTCTRGDHAFTYRYAFFFAPLWFCFFIVAIGLFSVYRGVRKQELKLAKYDPSRRRQKKSSSGGVRAKEPGNPNRRRSSGISLFTNNISEIVARGLSLDGSSAIKTPRARQVASQAVLYVLAFYLTYFFSSMNRVYQHVNGQSPYWVKLIQVLFQPLQGTWNFLIYRRPIYLRIRRNDPDLPILRALKRAILFSPTHSWRTRRPTRQTPPEINVHFSTTANDNSFDNNESPVLPSSMSDRIESVRESLRCSPMTSTEKQLLELEEMEVVGLTTRINAESEHWLAEYDAGDTRDDHQPYSRDDDKDFSSSEDEEPPILRRDGTMTRSDKKAPLLNATEQDYQSGVELIERK